MEPANASKAHVAIQGFLRLASPFPQISQIFGDQNDVTVGSAFRNRFFEVINATFQQSFIVRTQSLYVQFLVGPGLR